MTPNKANSADVKSCSADLRRWAIKTNQVFATQE